MFVDGKSRLQWECKRCLPYWEEFMKLVYLIIVATVTGAAVTLICASEPVFASEPLRPKENAQASILPLIKDAATLIPDKYFSHQRAARVAVLQIMTGYASDAEKTMGLLARPHLQAVVSAQFAKHNHIRGEVEKAEQSLKTAEQYAAQIRDPTWRAWVLAVIAETTHSVSGNSQSSRLFKAALKNGAGDTYVLPLIAERQIRSGDSAGAAITFGNAISLLGPESNPTSLVFIAHRSGFKDMSLEIMRKELDRLTSKSSFNPTTLARYTWDEVLQSNHQLAGLSSLASRLGELKLAREAASAIAADVSSAQLEAWSSLAIAEMKQNSPEASGSLQRAEQAFEALKAGNARAYLVPETQRVKELAFQSKPLAEALAEFGRRDEALTLLEKYPPGVSDLEDQWACSSALEQAMNPETARKNLSGMKDIEKKFRCIGQVIEKVVGNREHDITEPWIYLPDPEEYEKAPSTPTPPLDAKTSPIPDRSPQPGKTLTGCDLFPDLC